MKDLEWGGAKWAGSQVSMQSRTTNGPLTGEKKNVYGGRGGGGRIKRLCVYGCVLFVDARGDECECVSVCVFLHSIPIRRDPGEKYIQHFIHYTRSQLSSARSHLRARSQSAWYGRNCAACTA